MQIFDEVIHPEFLERWQNGLAVVIARDGENAQSGMSLLPLPEERRQTVENELRLLDRQAQRSSRGRALTQVSSKNQSVCTRANRRFPRGAVEIHVTM
jgi:hypothetical protein